MAYFIIWSFLVFVVATLAKFIYDVQQNKKKEKEADELCKIEAEFEAKEQFQKLAGIGLPKNQTDPELWKYMADKMSKEGFPAPDPSIPITTAKLTTIETKFEDYDPLASVPMSRVSKEAKKKMADIAKQDISKQLEEKTANIHPNDLYAIETVLDNVNKMPDEIKEAMIIAPIVKPKRKYTKKTK